MGNLGLMDIVRAHSELGTGIATPDTITAVLYRNSNDGLTTWLSDMGSNWYLSHGTILGAHMWEFPEDLNAKIVFAPDYLATEGFTYIKTRDEPKETGLCLLQVRELEYQLAKPPE